MDEHRDDGIELDLPSEETASGAPPQAEQAAVEFPSAELLEEELSREKHRKRFRSALKSTFFSLLVVSAAAVILAMLILPVLQITGSSMTDTLHDGDIVIAVKVRDFRTGEVVAFYQNNNILIKRVIAGPGDWVSIDDDGFVKVNGTPIDEPYVKDRSRDPCDIELPFQVPEGMYFVMGDHRLTSIDSRSTALGCVSKDRIVGKLLFRIWPLNSFGAVR